MQRVIADVDPRNEGSIGILRKFGFEETGREKRTFETHLGWCDSVYFELRRCGRGGKVGAARSGVGWIFV